MKTLLFLSLLAICFSSCMDGVARNYVIVRKVNQTSDGTYYVWFEHGDDFYLETKDQYVVGDTLFKLNTFK